jgi:FtsP/CotA-like multicopper oxidase with cupredoxin domain
MRAAFYGLLTLFILLTPSATTFAQSTPQSGSGEACPRPAVGAEIPEPQDLRSKNGVLTVDLTFRNYKDAEGRTRYCYVYGDGSVSPNLRLSPGDLLILRLKNAAVDERNPAKPAMAARKPEKSGTNDPCVNGAMSATSTNLHFHGLNIPPVCHQDETLKTLIGPSDAPFEYRFQIPADAPPGLYWYHPHPHGFAKAQILGGASGALIIEGLEREAPAVAGLPERVLVVRDEDLLRPDAEPEKSANVPAPLVLRDAEGEIINTGTGTGKPAKDLSINFVSAPFPDYTPALIQMRPGTKEVWRVLNASAFTYLDLQLLYDGKPQLVGLVGLDGIPVHEAGNTPHDVVYRSHLLVPPAGRAEFIVQSPPQGKQASLVTRTVDTGPVGENDPTRPLAKIEVTNDAPATASRLPARPDIVTNAKLVPSSTKALIDESRQPREAPSANPNWVGNFPAVVQRKLYFSEEPQDPKDPNSPTKFYITVEGQKPKQFDMHDAAPNIVVRQGDVEEWTIENRSRELHAFHIHQIHFELEDWNGVPVDEPFLRDTINVPYWDGTSTNYPSVKLKMDFRDPRIIGTFVYHCHLLEHEDGGMMGTVRVEAAPK